MVFFDVHTHKKTSLENVFSIVNTYPNSIDFTLPFSIGMHPWFINEYQIEEDLLIIEKKLQEKNCFALGECGLDKFIATDFELQKLVFKKQIILSENYQKPLIIHCVKAFQEVIAFKKECNPRQIWVLHGFYKNLQVAKSLLKNGFMLSFGAEIINNKKLQEVVSEIPLASILLETDAAATEITAVYEKVADIKNIEVVMLQQQIKQNFKNIFKK
ncbi:MAG: TatD DNase family protein [Polaribacter sp.]|jgi:TatD DNase family protein